MTRALYNYARHKEFDKLILRARTHPKEVQYKDEFGCVALHWLASWNAPLDVIEAVYEIDPNHADLKNCAGTTPCDAAVFNTASDNIIRLLQKGACKHEPLANLPSSDQTIELKQSLSSILADAEIQKEKDAKIIENLRSDLEATKQEADVFHAKAAAVKDKEVERTQKIEMLLEEKIALQEKVIRLEEEKHTISSNGGVKREFGGVENHAAEDSLSGNIAKKMKMEVMKELKVEVDKIMEKKMNDMLQSRIASLAAKNTSS
eukprot:CAMPEP_0171310822 /NCGR_PEP_ID=MMETSP0816-20121228/21019_1 /TAXON_ID=420281 /ORGANISM="Proboscia inermis, Strain CCAP1064/1" /LENGTH=261 /DNA_ID=CAMNT_0011795173 /DNA_START=119 /DNA_END=904 /DNA_ORIENTATION=+